jgi:hypothetical protein
MPPRLKRAGSTPWIDWASRDASIAGDIKQAAQIIKTFKGKPTRITIAAIGRNMDRPELLPKRGDLPSLPLSAKALAKALETRIDFAIRRVWWAVDSFRQEKTFPARSYIFLRSAIGSDIWRVPEVIKAVDSGWECLRQSTLGNNSIAA